MDDLTQRDRSVSAALALVVGVAVVTGLPSLRGGFLAGDDIHLVLNHVLVNHPSLSHAVRILSESHRDLYQPIPMLSFSFDFAVIGAFGLRPTTIGPHAGAWVFHLTNVVLHALNAALVLLVMKRFTGRLAVAVAAAVLFAVHPLAAEPIAWLNGRMMMLSTCFTLLTVLAFDRWDSKPTAPRAGWVVLCCLLAHMSKISVALPVLIALCPFAQYRRPVKRWWVMWAVVAVITGGFTWLNIETSSEMFEIAEGEMEAPKILYVLLALAQYFRQYVVPIGLSVWYPPPAELGWTDPAVLSAAVTVLLVGVLTLVSMKRTRVVVLGMLWFMAAVFPTLPIVPARRAVGADRYVYLPKIGLAWIAATALIALYGYAARRMGKSCRMPLLAGAVVIAAVFVGVSWETQGYHRNDITAALRNIQTNPDFPGVYKQAAWAYHRNGEYENAIEIAAEEMSRHPAEMACEVLQVVGMSQFRLGRHEEALASLQMAIEADPDFGKCYSRLAKIQRHVGRTDEAIANYERAVEIMPFYNPALLPLASLYRSVGRLDDAIRTFNEVLQNNAYDVDAHLDLAEIDIQRQRYPEAVDRLTKLLGWMPENAIARTNLGAAYVALGKIPEAVDAYTVALMHDPRNATAAVNLANLYLYRNDAQEALRLYDSQMPYHDTDLGFLIAHHDFALAIDRADLTAAAFIKAYNKAPTDVDLRSWTAYALAQAGDCKRAALLLKQIPPAAPSAVRPLAAVLIALVDDAPETAIPAVEGLLKMTPLRPPDVMERLTADLQRLAARHPENPWPHFLTARLLLAQDDQAHARLALDEFTRLCPSDDCRNRAAELLP